MSKCALCHTPEAGVRVSGLDLCTACTRRDPTPALAQRGIEVEWNVRLGRFQAGLGIPHQPSDFWMTCTPERLAHKLLKLGMHEVQVGDPLFDAAVFIRTNDPERARERLAIEGVQSALLRLLSDVRGNDLAGNKVALEAGGLTVGIHPLGGLEPATILALELECAVLALHLLRLTAPRRAADR